MQLRMWLDPTARLATVWKNVVYTVASLNDATRLNDVIQYIHESLSHGSLQTNHTKSDFMSAVT